MAVSLKIGPPVEGNDFYGRQKEIVLAQRRLQGNNLMLAAPRRVGKTSFSKVILARMREEGWNGIFIDMEGLPGLPAFFDAVHQELMLLPNVGKSQQLLNFLKSHMPNIDLAANLGGIEAKLALTRQVSAGFVNLQANLREIHAPTLIVLDEMTVFLEKLLRSEGEDLVKDFLNQFRALRQASGTDCRWMVASSIGVRNFASLHCVSDTLNDFSDFPLGAYPDDEAIGLVSELAVSEGIGISPSGMRYFLSKIGWNIPYFIQLLMSGLPAGKTTKTDIDAAYENILLTTAFETWSERLTKEYGENKPYARRILDYLCLHPAGKEREEIRNQLAGSGITDVQFSSLLTTLESDGYLGKEATLRYFRSPLLRDYWKRKFCE